MKYRCIAAQALIRIAVAVMVICSGAYAHAGEWDTKSDIRVGPGMKVIKAGDASVMVPEGGMTYRDDQGRIYTESADAYAARGFIETENRIGATEADTVSLKDRVKALEDKLKETTRRLQELERDKFKKET